MTTDEGIVYDRSLLGVEHPVGTFTVTKEMITVSLVQQVKLTKYTLEQKTVRMM